MAFSLTLVLMIFILDAAALLNNEFFSFEPENKYYTTSRVFAEWRDLRSRALARSAFESGLLIVQDPCELSVQKTFERAQDSGTDLSDADISLAALAAEFKSRGEKFRVITDDYSVQNILKKIKVNFEGVAHKKIKRHKSFKKKKN